MKKTFILLLAFSIIPFAREQAQSKTSIAHSVKVTSTKASLSLKGQITDQEGFPLEGALVFIPELNKSCSADPDGHYLMQNLPARSLDVQFSFLGYAHQLKKVNVSNAGTLLNVKLEPSPIEAEEIVVTGGQHST